MLRKICIIITKVELLWLQGAEFFTLSSTSHLAISVKLLSSIKTLKIDIWGPVVKCVTFNAPRQSRRAQKYLASLETVSAGNRIYT